MSEMQRRMNLDLLCRYLGTIEDDPTTVYPFWQALDNAARRDLLLWCHANPVGPRVLGPLLRDAWLRKLTDEPAPGMPTYCDLDDEGRRELFQWSRQSNEVGPLLQAAWRLQQIRSSLSTASLHGAWDIPPAVLADLIERSDPEMFMGAESLARFRRLPAMITVYRGSAGVPVETARLGMSWTPNKAAAKEYAWRNGDSGAPVILLTGRCRKTDVLAGLNLDSDLTAEFPEIPEFICRSGAVRLTKIKTWRPGEFPNFWAAAA